MFDKVLRFGFIFQFGLTSALSTAVPAYSITSVDELPGYTPANAARANPALIKEYFFTHPEALSSIGGTNHLEAAMADSGSYEDIVQHIEGSWLEDIFLRSQTDGRSAGLSGLYGMPADIDWRTTYNHSPAMQEMFAEVASNLGDDGKSNNLDVLKATLAQEFIIASKYQVSPLELDTEEAQILDSDIKTLTSTLTPETGALVPYQPLAERVEQWAIDKAWSQMLYEDQRLVGPCIKHQLKIQKDYERQQLIETIEEGAELSPESASIFQSLWNRSWDTGSTLYNGVSSSATAVGSYAWSGAEMVGTGASTVGSYAWSGVEMIGTGATTIGSGLYNVLSFVVQTTAEARDAKRMFVNEGLDLYPLIKQSLSQSAIHGMGLYDDFQEWWKQPAEDYPPAVKNIIVGMSQDFSPKLHFLLINASKALGPEYAADIFQKLNITQAAGTSIANKMLKFSNPLGWASTVISLANLGFNIADIVQGGLLGKLKPKIIQLAGKATGVPIELIQAKQDLVKLTLSLKLEEEQYARYLEENALAHIDDPNSYALTNALWSMGTNLRNSANEPDSLTRAREAFRKAKEKYGELKESFIYEGSKGFRDEFKQELKLTAQNDLTKGLEKTLRRTLSSLIADLNEYFKDPISEQAGSNAKTAEYMQEALRLLILGPETEDYAEFIHGGKAQISEAKAVSDVIKNVAKNPMQLVKNWTPQMVADVANGMCAATNKVTGRVVGFGAGQLTKQFINGLNLEKLELYGASELDLNIDACALGKQHDLPPHILSAVSFFGELVDINSTLESLLRDVGKQAGILFSEMLAKAIQQQIEEKTGKKHSIEDLTSKEISTGITDDVFNSMARMGSEFRNFFWTPRDNN